MMGNNEAWRKAHGQVIAEFLLFLNKNTDQFVLKGGTSLSQCYDLDRFSEDIDLDGSRKDIKDIVNKFCEAKGYELRIAKDTETVKRCFVHYKDGFKPLKIEVSYRRRDLDLSESRMINGIKVYDIDRIAQMKCNAYISRDKIRDLYDLSFICNNYYDELSKKTINQISDALEYKGLEQFDYIIQTQEDELIDNDKLAADFLRMYEKIGLLYDEKPEIFDKVIVKDEKALNSVAEIKEYIKEELNNGNSLKKIQQKFDGTLTKENFTVQKSRFRTALKEVEKCPKFRKFFEKENCR